MFPFDVGEKSEYDRGLQLRRANIFSVRGHFLPQTCGYQVGMGVEKIARVQRNVT